MRTRALVLYICIVTAIVSCQKGYSPDGLVLPNTGTGGGGTTTGTLLVKSESKTTGSSEASSTIYEYDVNKRVSKIITSETDASNVTVIIAYRYVRDTDGKITSIVTNALAAGSPNSGMPDSITINIHYPTGSTAFDYSAYSVTLSGVKYTDSVTYAYSGSNISETVQYQVAVGSPTILAGKVQSTYANSNLTQQKVFEFTGMSLAQTGTYDYEYDDKINSLKLGNECFLAGMNGMSINKNNLTKLKVTDLSGNNGSFTVNYTYQYNTSSMPISGTGTETVGNSTATFKYTYQ